MSSNQAFVPIKKGVCEECFRKLHHWHPEGEDNSDDESTVKFFAICPIGIHEILSVDEENPITVKTAKVRPVKRTTDCQCKYHNHWDGIHPEEVYR